MRPSVSAAVRWWELTRPVPRRKAEVLARRWAELPSAVRTPAQLIGRHAVGCEGTHGVFPRCDLTCSPCYHSAGANQVRTDSGHTLRQVRSQMALLNEVRGPHGHAQLIGGEVTLLDPDTHAEALLIMRSHGREPMSMSHGDFDDHYLRRLALGADGAPRLRRLSFAGHFDSLMRGRAGIPRPRTELDLEPYRRRFVEMFRRLKAEHGVASYLAHNMTVTPGNVAEVADVVRTTMPLGFDMLSFQPAAHMGDERRWREDFRSMRSDDVWTQIERGAGTRLPWRALQMGDPRCNRTAWGWTVDGRFIPLLDDEDPRDLSVRDLVLERFGGLQLTGSTLPVVALRLLRLSARNPGVLPSVVRWAGRAVRRSGGLRTLLRQHRRVRPMTFVMHTFMDAAEVAPAWELMERGITADEPAVRATQERLQACVYAMAHPALGRLVPACVQHSLLDPGETDELRRLLPIMEVTTRARSVVEQ